MNTPSRTAVRHLKRGVRGAAAALGWHPRPDFLIVGAQKAGTTALFEYLNRHPRLAGSVDKETYFFSPESYRGWSGHGAFPFYQRLKWDGFSPAPKRWARRWYYRQFPLRRPGARKLYFEATPDYLYYPLVPERIRAHLPNVKLIVLLRDPVARAYSAWNMFRDIGENDRVFGQLRERRSFEEAVDGEIARLGGEPLSEGSDYVRRGFYEDQLRRFATHFSRDQILVIESTELEKNLGRTLATVCDFLGVERFADNDQFEKVGVGNYPEAMACDIRERLAELYAPRNLALFELLGRHYDWEA
jgi:hypothetical protein